MENAITKSKSLVEQTTHDIIEYIVERKMQPGEKLPTEAEFLDYLNVSRGTLRESFKILSARNILEVRQGSGTFISPEMGIPEDPLGLTMIYDDHTLALDLLEVRIMLEPHIASAAAINITNSQIVELKKCHDKLIDNIRKDVSYEKEDMMFHRLIADACGNKVLANLSHILYNSIEKNIRLTMNTLKESNTARYHEKVLQAIVKRDYRMAYHSMNTHLSLFWELINDNYNSTKPFPE